MATKTKDYNFALSQVKLLMKESEFATEAEPQYAHVLSEVKQAFLIPQYFENCKLRLEEAFSDGFQVHDIPVIIKIFLTLNHQLSSIHLQLDDLKYVFYGVLILYMYRYDKIDYSDDNLIEELVKNPVTGKESNAVVDYMDLRLMRIFFKGSYDLITLDPSKFTLVGLKEKTEKAVCFC